MPVSSVTLIVYMTPVTGSLPASCVMTPVLGSLFSTGMLREGDCTNVSLEESDCLYVKVEPGSVKYTLLSDPMKNSPPSGADGLETTLSPSL